MQLISEIMTPDVATLGPNETIERAVKTLGRDKILGTVLNRADHASAGHYGYGYPRT